MSESKEENNQRQETVAQPREVKSNDEKETKSTGHNQPQDSSPNNQLRNNIFPSGFFSNDFVLRWGMIIHLIWITLTLTLQNFQSFISWAIMILALVMPFLIFNHTERNVGLSIISLILFWGAGFLGFDWITIPLIFAASIFLLFRSSDTITKSLSYMGIVVCVFGLFVSLGWTGISASLMYAITIIFTTALMAIGALGIGISITKGDIKGAIIYLAMVLVQPGLGLMLIRKIFGIFPFINTSWWIFQPANFIFIPGAAIINSNFKKENVSETSRIMMTIFVMYLIVMGVSSLGGIDIELGGVTYNLNTAFSTYLSLAKEGLDESSAVAKGRSLSIKEKAAAYTECLKTDPIHIKECYKKKTTVVTAQPKVDVSKDAINPLKISVISDTYLSGLIGKAAFNGRLFVTGDLPEDLEVEISCELKGTSEEGETKIPAIVSPNTLSREDIERASEVTERGVLGKQIFVKCAPAKQMKKVDGVTFTINAKNLENNRNYIEKYISKDVAADVEMLKPDANKLNKNTVSSGDYLDVAFNVHGGWNNLIFTPNKNWQAKLVASLVSRDAKIKKIQEVKITLPDGLLAGDPCDFSGTDELIVKDDKFTSTAIEILNKGERVLGLGVCSLKVNAPAVPTKRAITSYVKYDVEFKKTFS